MKDNIYPVIVFNGHVFAFFETNDLKEVCILFFYLHNTNTKVITQCEHQSPKRKLSYLIHPFLMRNSIFYLNLRLLREDVNFKFKVAKKLLTR